MEGARQTLKNLSFLHSFPVSEQQKASISLWYRKNVVNLHPLTACPAKDKANRIEQYIPKNNQYINYEFENYCARKTGARHT